MPDPKVTIRIEAQEQASAAVAKVQQSLRGLKAEAGAASGGVESFSGKLGGLGAEAHTMSKTARTTGSSLHFLGMMSGGAGGEMGGLSTVVRGLYGPLNLVSQGMTGLISLPMVGIISGITGGFVAWQIATRGVSDELRGVMTTTTNFLSQKAAWTTQLEQGTEKLKKDKEEATSWGNRFATGFAMAGAALVGSEKNINYFVDMWKNKLASINAAEELQDEAQAADRVNISFKKYVDTLERGKGSFQEVKRDLEEIINTQDKSKTLEQIAQMEELTIEITRLDTEILIANNRQYDFNNNIKDAIDSGKSLLPVIREWWQEYGYTAEKADIVILKTKEIINGQTILARIIREDAKKSVDNFARDYVKMMGLSKDATDALTPSVTAFANEWMKTHDSASGFITALQSKIEALQGELQYKKTREEAKNITASAKWIEHGSTGYFEAKRNAAIAIGRLDPSVRAAATRDYATQFGLAPAPTQKGGIITQPSIRLLGEAGPEAVIPLSKMGGMGGDVIVRVYLDSQEIAARSDKSYSRRIQSHAGG